MNIYTQSYYYYDGHLATTRLKTTFYHASRITNRTLHLILLTVLCSVSALGMIKTTQLLPITSLTTVMLQLE